MLKSTTPPILSTSVGMPRDHHAIFIEETVDGTGHIYQVTGSIQARMAIEIKRTGKPEESAEFWSKTRIGRVAVEDNQRIESVCQSVPAPKKQYDGPRRLYPEERIRRCQEWTAEAIEALWTAGVIQS